MGLSHEAAYVDWLATVLEIEHEIWKQVMTWFGDISLGSWKMDVDALMKQVGIGITRAHKVRTTDYNLMHLLMMTRLLECRGGYIRFSSPPFTKNNILLYAIFGHTSPRLLPVFDPTTFISSKTRSISYALSCLWNPPARFDLTRGRWSSKDITFLVEITVNAKERDK
jgi:sister chromatid cohesion protein DCC1